MVSKNEISVVKQPAILTEGRHFDINKSDALPVWYFLENVKLVVYRLSYFYEPKMTRTYVAGHVAATNSVGATEMTAVITNDNHRACQCSSLRQMKVRSDS